MELANPHSASWFVSLFHEYSITIDHWRKLSETKSSHVSQLQERLGALETEVRELRNSHAKQSEAIASYRGTIASLECELQQQRQAAFAFCSAPLSVEPTPHSEMHQPEDCYLSCSPSRLMTSEPPSLNEAITIEEESGHELVEDDRHTRKRKRTGE